MPFTRLLLVAGLLLLAPALSRAADADTAAKKEAKPARPEVGKKAADFTLPAVKGEKVQLSKLTQEGPVVLTVLRGYPGYQCPICYRQVGELLRDPKPIEQAGAHVVLVYPGAGPKDELAQRATEFLKNQKLPENFEYVVDPDYTFTNAYDLRWDAPRETAYPSTFIIDKSGTVRFAYVSMTHGDRVGAETIAKELAKLKAPVTDRAPQ